MIFDVTPDHIRALSDDDLRTLVGRLCEAETRAKGFEPVGVTYGGDQNAPDGGIDVRAEVPIQAAGGFVPRAVTAFQVKAANMPRSAIHGEMRPGGQLRPSIIAVDAYVIVSSKGAVADSALRDRLAAMREAVADAPAAAGLHLDFYDGQRVATWVNGHPPEIAWVRDRIGEPLRGWRPFADWSSAPDDLHQPYLLDDHIRLVAPQSSASPGASVAEGIAMLRSVLRKHGGVVRLVGLSGVGKTRLVQALFDARVGTDPLDPTTVIYADAGEGPDPAPLEILPRLKAARHCYVLVLDNCGSELHGRVAKRVRESGAQISLITIEYDVREDAPEGTDVFRLEPASAEIVEKILERRHPDLTGVERRSIAAFSEGNARIALALAAATPEGGSLANLGNRDLFERLFRQQQADDPGLLRAARVLSLVYSFDGETIDRPNADLPILASLAGMRAEELHAHVAELRRRQLVQHRSRWRALLPHALAHRLAKAALQDIPAPTIQLRLVEQGDERLLKSFSRRLGYLHDSAEARAIVESWLSVGGFLGETANLSDLGATIFENVAPVDPGRVLQALERACGTGIAAIETADRRVRWMVGLLRSIAYEAQYFDEALTLMARLTATGKNSTDVAAAMNVFASMFRLYLSGTHAPPQQRADFLCSLAEADLHGAADLVIAGLEAMLECDHFSSSLNFEFGSRKRDYGLRPGREQVQDWFRVAFRLAADLNRRSELREGIRRVVARRFRSLALRTGVLEEAVVLARKLSADGGWVQGWRRAKAAERDARKAQREKEAATLAALVESLRPTSLDEMVKAYVFDEGFELLPEDEDGVEVNSISRSIANLDAIRVDLGRQLARDPDTLDRLVPELVEHDGSGPGAVGYEIGRYVVNPRTLWENVVQRLVAGGPSAPVGGFSSQVLRGIADRDPALAAQLLDEALNLLALHPLFVHMQATVGLGGRGIERLMAAAQLPSVPSGTFHILAWGGLSVPLDGEKLRDLLRLIADREGGTEVALKILSMRFFGRKQQSMSITIEEREIGRYIAEKFQFDCYNRERHYGLKEILAECFLPGENDEAATLLCKRLRDTVISTPIPPWGIGSVVASIGRKFPRVVLDVFVLCSAVDADELDSSVVSRSPSRGGVLGEVDEAVMLGWARERADERFPALARIVRPWVQKGETRAKLSIEEDGPLEWSSIGLLLMREANDPMPVLKAYEQRLHPSEWSGSLADLLATRVQLLNQLLDEPDCRIRGWAARVKQHLADEARLERGREAAQARARDERFDW
jgi:hypothetical protein